MNEQERFGYSNPNAPTINSDVGRGQRARLAEERCAEFVRASQTAVEPPSACPSQGSAGASTATPSTLGDTAKAFAWVGAVLGGLYGYFGFQQSIVVAGTAAGVGALAGAMAGGLLYIAFRLLAIALKVGLVLGALYLLAVLFGVVKV